MLHPVKGNVVKSSNVSQSKSDKKDYKELLSDVDFPIFCELRKWRYDYADSRGIKAFEILTNDQLAEVVEKRLNTIEGLCSMKVFGDARGNKY